MVTGDSTQNLHLRILPYAPLLYTATRWPKKWSFINLGGRKDTKSIGDLKYQRLADDPEYRRVKGLSRDLRSPSAIFLFRMWIVLIMSFSKNPAVRSLTIICIDMDFAWVFYEGINYISSTFFPSSFDFLPWMMLAIWSVTVIICLIVFGMVFPHLMKVSIITKFFLTFLFIPNSTTLKWSKLHVLIICFTTKLDIS